MADNKINQELLMRASALHQQSQELEQQLEFIEKQINELSDFSKSLSNLSKTSQSEILAPLGKGVFIKSDIKDKKLFVEIGSGVVIRKTPEETSEVITSQISKLNELKAHISSQLDAFHKIMAETIGEIEAAKESKTE